MRSFGGLQVLQLVATDFSSSSLWQCRWAAWRRHACWWFTVESSCCLLRFLCPILLCWSFTENEIPARSERCREKGNFFFFFFFCLMAVVSEGWNLGSAPFGARPLAAHLKEKRGPLVLFFPSAKTLPTTSCSPNVRPTRRAFFFHLPTKSDRYISKLLSASSFFFHGLLDTVVVKTHLPQKVGLGFFFFFNFFLRRKRSASGWAPGIGANAAPRKAGQL